VDAIKGGDFTSLNKSAMDFSDGIVMGSESLNDELATAFEETKKLKMEFESEEVKPKLMNEFFDKVIDEEAVIQ